MALPSAGIIEVRTGGSDNYGGLFNPGNANFATNLAATSATGSSPVVTSATYNFVAGDIGSYVFIKSGTNWTPGFYKISSVASSAATLDASVGAVLLYQNGALGTYNTTVGCATTASPTGGTWGLDYSQQNGAAVAYTDLVVGGTTTMVTSATSPFGPNHIGNTLQILSGAGATTGTYEVVSVSTVTATLDRSAGTAASVATANLGGALASVGKAGAIFVAGNDIEIASGTYLIASATNNISTGCLSMTAQAASANAGRCIGYGTKRRDSGTKPLLQASGSISTFTIITVGTGNHCENISVDCNDYTSGRGFSVGSARAIKCKAVKCKNSGFFSGGLVLCEASLCSVTIAISAVSAFFCYSHANTISGLTASQIAYGCISANNSGASSHGIDFSFQFGRYISCIVYGNGGDGFRENTGAGNAAHDIANCIIYGNSGYGINCTALHDQFFAFGCAVGGNNSGGVQKLNTVAANMVGEIPLSANPFNAPGSDDFTLLTNSGGGALLRALGYFQLIPGTLSTINYADVGVIQHQDSGGGGSTVKSLGILTGGRL